MKTKTHKKLSVPFFIAVVSATFALYLLAIKTVAPGVWAIQVTSSISKILINFSICHLIAAFAEFFFHRYNLHRPFPFLESLYRQHTLHHNLTKVALINVSGGRGKVFTKYPILVENQYEASYFPWYSLAIFLMISLIISIPAQMVLPNWPVMLGMGMAVTWSIVLYEIMHMIEHLSFDTFWKPKVTHKTFGGFWTSVYCFHMRHHYNIDCNEGISAFFGIPIPDFVFGTYAPWPRAFEHNEKVSVEEFVSSPPKPVAVIVWLDRLFV